MSTITLARIYERQGHIDDALAIYTRLLQDKPQSSDIQKAIQRLKHRDTKKISYFTKMHTKEQIAKFERWLVKPWS